MSLSAQSENKTLYTEALNKIFMQDMPDATTFLDNLLRESVKLNASDILLEPQQTNLTVRIRIDGELYELGNISMNAYPAITSRIKIVSNLDPTEKRHVQEGQISYQQDGNIVNFRVEIAQTINGELIVLRVFERKTVGFELSQLGMTQVAFKIFENMLKAKSGLLLVCGPTGCGKTTTLYATINELAKSSQYNIMTIEDPIEYQLDGINQMQTQNEKGFTFAAGLKTILRLSPDVILVGEIRDRETAQIAVESSLTGHLVLSTLHANDTVGALLRLLDLNIEPYILNSALIGIVAQRLVRKSCQFCRENYQPNQEELELFNKVIGRPPKQLSFSKGCEQCQKLGYKGRTAIFEILPTNTQIRSLIRSKASEEEIRRVVQTEEGFMSLLRNGLEKSELGVTTIPEVLKNSLSIV
jgi:type IV pilus assembly protein PilB